MKAIKIVDTDKAELVTDATLTKDPCPDELLLKTVAVALNPTDWKHVGFGIPTRPTVGCDFAGVVEDVGPAVTRFKKGDRVWGMVHGSNQLRPDNAAFQEYLYAKEGVTVKIADDMSFEEAASLGVSRLVNNQANQADLTKFSNILAYTSYVLTVGQGMYQEMPIPWPNNPLREKKQILIYGGSSATGALGIQFAKLSGFEVLTTAGKNNFDYVKSLGADAVFDSRSLTVGEEIREYTKDKLCYVWDTIGEYGSDEASAKALASKAPDGQKLYYGTILLKDITDFVARRGTLEPRPDDVIQSMSLGYTAVGEAFEIKGTKFPARPEDYEFAKKWMQFAGELIAQGKIKPHRVVSRYGGFESLVDGLEDLKNGVSGVKLVYQVAQVAEP